MRQLLARRRVLLLAGSLGALHVAHGDDTPVHASASEAVPTDRIAFPRDEGAHRDSRIEWWYLTGWLAIDGGAPALGFQVTFFRARRDDLAPESRSRFASRDIVFAHVALADPAEGRLLKADDIARTGFGRADAAIGDLAVHLGHWRLERLAQGRYRTRIDTEDFTLDLAFSTTQPPLLQGEAGRSRKGADPAAFSWYYSLPQLAVEGRVRSARRNGPVRGTAWFDHEWSDRLLPDDAAGWDWIGLNLLDGRSVMAFRIRGRDGRLLWTDAAVRDAAGRLDRPAPGSIAFEPAREWTSPRSGARYPVAQRVAVGALRLELVPLLDDQEVDARGSSGQAYWEGAVEARIDGRAAGRGYLELTGYAGAIHAGR